MNEYKEENFPRPQEEEQGGYGGQVTILPMPFWALLLIGGFLFLQGCASTAPESKVCFMQIMGRTGDGVPVVRMNCLTEEAFAESQK